MVAGCFLLPEMSVSRTAYYIYYSVYTELTRTTDMVNTKNTGLRGGAYLDLFDSQNSWVDKWITLKIEDQKKNW